MSEVKDTPCLFPVDEWRLAERELNNNRATLAETLLAQGNGYIGSRGTHEEGYVKEGNSCEGTYLNGVYVKSPIHYEESAYGFATHNDKMLQVPSAKDIKVKIAGEYFLPGESKVSNYERYLDFKTGILHRSLLWETKNGHVIKITSERFISLKHSHAMVLKYSIESEDYTGDVIVESCLDAAYGAAEYNPDDPRVGHLSIRDALTLKQHEVTDENAYFVHQVTGDEFSVCTTLFQTLETEGEISREAIDSPMRLGQVYHFTITPGQAAELTKMASYHHSRRAQEQAMVSQAQESLQQVVREGWPALKKAQEKQFANFWQSADISIEGAPELQQGIRFSMLHLFQSAGRDGASNIAAKGLTGPGYDGHYFWDTEIYMMPFFVHSDPKIARKLLEFRYGLLEASRNRARQMGHVKGALYAWRTISGDECSAYFPAGTAQYHINAAIAYAVKRYVEVSGDEEYLWQQGAEMLCETARIWMDLGHFNSLKEGKFTIHGVTGPDEYTAIVDNNFYTNAMAQQHLHYAVQVMQQFSRQDAKAYATLCNRLDVEEEEISHWQQAADKMYLPYSEELGINPQDETFLQKPKWDFENTPKEKYPLLLHFHPLVIYRHQMLKQADVILAMVLLHEKFGLNLLRKNLEYYEPITTFDSTLASCIYSIANAWAGNEAQAYAFFEDAARMDIDNHHANTAYGVHTACMAGSWQSIVYGFGGMQYFKGTLKFSPTLPVSWQGYSFRINFQGRLIEVAVSGDKVTYLLKQGNALDVFHKETSIALIEGDTVECSIDQRECAA